MTITRPATCAHACRTATDRIAGILAPYGEVINPGFVEYEPDADRATEAFNGAGVDLIIALELAYQKGIIPMRTLLRTQAPILIWNTQQIRRLPEEADFDLIMENSGMCGLPELTSALIRSGRPFELLTSHIADPDGLKTIGEYAAAAGSGAPPERHAHWHDRPPVRGHDRPDGRLSQPAGPRRPGGVADRAREGRRGGPRHGRQARAGVRPRPGDAPRCPGRASRQPRSFGAAGAGVARRRAARQLRCAGDLRSGLADRPTASASSPASARATCARNTSRWPPKQM